MSHRPFFKFLKTFDYKTLGFRFIKVGEEILQPFLLSPFLKKEDQKIMLYYFLGRIDLNRSHNTPNKASLMMLPFILDSPAVRSVNMIGISLIEKPNR